MYLTHRQSNTALALLTPHRVTLRCIALRDMGSSENADVPGGAVAVDKGVDFAQYFCTYAFLYHQKEMLSDRVRMNAYFNAIFENKHHFYGKVILFTVILLFDYLV